MRRPPMKNANILIYLRLWISFPTVYQGCLDLSTSFRKGYICIHVSANQLNIPNLCLVGPINNFVLIQLYILITIILYP